VLVSNNSRHTMLLCLGATHHTSPIPSHRHTQESPQASGLVSNNSRRTMLLCLGATHHTSPLLSHRQGGDHRRMYVSYRIATSCIIAKYDAAHVQVANSLAYTHTHTHIHTHTYTHIHIYTRTQNTPSNRYTLTHTCIHTTQTHTGKRAHARYIPIPHQVWTLTGPQASV
jgi:hypothetical protein